MMIPASYRAMGVDPDFRRPVFAVLRIGKKHGDRGQPTDRGNFYVVEPTADQREFRKSGGGSYKALYREDHPDFATYNQRQTRTTFRGILPYAELTRCWEVRRWAAKLPGFPQHPNLFLTCESRDGETAERLYQVGQQRADASIYQQTPEPLRVEGKPEDEDWRSIRCPGRLCEFAQSGECKTRAWLYFICNEPEQPRVLMRYQTGGQATTIQNIGAFFEDLDHMAAAAGVELRNVAGIPFVLNLSVAISRKHGRRMPVVTMALDGTMTEVLAARRADVELSGGHIEAQLLPARTDTDDEPSKALDIIDAEPSKPGKMNDSDSSQEEELVLFDEEDF